MPKSLQCDESRVGFSRKCDRLASKVGKGLIFVFVVGLSFSAFFVHTLDIFYVKGGFFWDQGLNAYNAAFSDRWPMIIHPIYDYSDKKTSYFSIHFDLIFYITSPLHRILSLPPAVFFSGLEGLVFSVLAASATTFCLPRPCEGRAQILVGIAVALLTVFNGAVLAMMDFPVIEDAIPCLIVGFIAARGVGKPGLAALALALGLTIREDAGLHAGILFAILAAAQHVSHCPRERVRETLWIALLCTAWSVVLFLCQRLWFDDGPSRFSAVYLGNPPLSHVTFALIRSRIIVYLTGKAYLTGPMIALLVVAVVRRDIIMAVASVAVIPWVLVSLIATTHAAGLLENYYGFPFILVMVWPTARRFLVDGSPGLGWRPAITLQGAVGLFSIVAFALWGENDHNTSPWRGLQVPPWRDIGTQEAALKRIVDHRADLGRIMVDDAVASLIPEAIGKYEWNLMWVARTSAAVPDIGTPPDVMIYRQAAYDHDQTELTIRTSGLSWRYRLAGTPFLVNSRTAIVQTDLGLLPWSTSPVQP